MGLLEGKCILITGAAQGMGAVHARRCVEEGATVILSDRQAESGEKVAAELGDKAFFVQHDIVVEDDWNRVVEVASQRCGRIDGLVNNAAIWWTQALLDESADRIRSMLDVNVVGTWLGMKAVAPLMREAGVDRL